MKTQLINNTLCKRSVVAPNMWRCAAFVVAMRKHNEVQQVSSLLQRRTRLRQSLAHAWLPSQLPHAWLHSLGPAWSLLLEQTASKIKLWGAVVVARRWGQHPLLPLHEMFGISIAKHYAAATW